MNSLPFISHHLFVAAIGPEGRGQESAPRRDRMFAGTVSHASASALELMETQKPMAESAPRVLRTEMARART